MSRVSRVAVIGPNGAGKSTAIKLLIGELTASQGAITKHPNMRLAYVAQVRFRLGFWGLRLGLSVHHTLIYMSSIHTHACLCSTPSTTWRST